MKKVRNRKAQADAATIILLVFVMILIVVLIIVVLIYGFPGFFSSERGISGKNVEESNKESDYVLKIVNDCPSPYIKVGGNCCLDQNYNAICDNDEAKKKTEVIAECSYPYLKIGSECCLDDDRDGTCDRYERDYNDGTIDEDGYLKFPFSMTDVDFFRDEIVIEIKNKDDEDYTIKSIDISGCDEEDDFDTLIPEGKRKEFSIDCEDARDRSSRSVEVFFEDSKGKEDSVTGRVSYD